MCCPAVSLSWRTGRTDRTEMHCHCQLTERTEVNEHGCAVTFSWRKHRTEMRCHSQLSERTELNEHGCAVTFSWRTDRTQQWTAKICMTHHLHTHYLLQQLTCPHVTATDWLLSHSVSLLLSLSRRRVHILHIMYNFKKHLHTDSNTAIKYSSNYEYYLLRSMCYNICGNCTLSVSQSTAAVEANNLSMPTALQLKGH